MSNKIKALLNFFSVILVLAVNYYSQTGKINGQTVGGLSDEYQNLFTPAGYAFAIWGIIFLSMIAYVIYQVVQVFFKNNVRNEFKQTGYWFALVNLGNASWVVAWLYEYTLLSLGIMTFMLIGLIIIIIRTNMERWDAPFSIIAFIWWPICLYSGWIAVATIANVSAYLSKLGWEGGFLSEVQWTIVMIVIATVVNLFMIWKRNMREFALVGVWALYAIHVRHQESYTTIAMTALIMAGLLLVNIAIHGFKNRSTNPFAKLLGKA